MKIRAAQPADAAAIARVHVDTWRSAYSGILADDILDALTYERREQMWKQSLARRPAHTFLYVAETGDGQIVGFVSGGENREEDSRYAGEIYAIYLLAAYQGRGWGRELFQRAVEALAAEGHDSFMLWVLADNPTRGFYEALGGVEIGEKETEIAGRSYKEVAYGWKRQDGSSRSATV